VNRDVFNSTRLLRAPSSLALNVSGDGASTTSLGYLFQCFPTLSIKNAGAQRQDKGQWAQPEAEEVPPEHKEELLHSEGDEALEQAA